MGRASGHGLKKRGGAHWGERAPPQQRRIGGNHCRCKPRLRSDMASVLRKEDNTTAHRAPLAQLSLKISASSVTPHFGHPETVSDTGSRIGFVHRPSQATAGARSRIDRG